MQEGSREFGGSPDPTGFDSEDDGDDVPTDGPIVLSSHRKFNLFLLMLLIFCCYKKLIHLKL